MCHPDGKTVQIQDGGVGMRREKRKRKIYMPGQIVCAVLSAFVFVFSASMGLSTLLVKESTREEFDRIRHEMATGIADSLLDESRSFILSGGQLEEGWIKNAADSVISRYVCVQDTPYLLLSAALYDSRGSLVVRSGERFVLYRSAYVEEAVGSVWDLKAYFSEEELCKLAVYAAEEAKIPQKENPPVSYRFYGETDTEGTELTAFQVNKITWEETDAAAERSAQPVKTDCVWKWGTPEEDAAEENAGSLCFPALNLGEDVWKRWRENVFLREFPEMMKSKCSSMGTTVYTEETELFQGIYPIRFAEGEMELSPQVYTLFIREEARPWMAAMDDMKYIYLGGGVLVLLCAIFTCFVLEKTYRRKQMLEQRRCDFTNAVAHELKTPLGVIRGFAENLGENPDTDKRKYYVERIIGQTEDMDEIVKEMIQVSRMD